MAQRHADIVIFGAGIAGLWAHNRFRRAGYNVLLLESATIGGGQTIASQGIIHSGLKYAFAGKINKLAASISAMPDLWRAALKGEGPVDLSAAQTNADSQMLLIPPGLMGGLVGLVAKRTLGNNVHEITQKSWPEYITDSGFKGRLVYMDEPVLDIPSVLRALGGAYQDSIRKIDTPDEPMAFLERHGITADHIIFTGAASNHAIARHLHHDKGLETQARPLLMGMLKNAPFPLYAHCVGSSDKPLATITTHTLPGGDLVWYLGGGVAERPKDAPPQDVYKAAKKAFQTSFPALDFTTSQWAVLPIDRIEGKSSIDGWMPDTPTIHQQGHIFYSWPTKLTFAPLLAERLAEKITAPPSNRLGDWSFLPEVPYAKTPWENAQWNEDL
ncbi:MAG: FAD-dependent oxidoreductase [Alphaproteobacteria bacterium]|nr:FAD-dependent oxidoreductase [Alphaproteobacteria bacterium]